MRSGESASGFPGPAFYKCNAIRLTILLDTVYPLDRIADVL